MMTDHHGWPGKRHPKGFADVIQGTDVLANCVDRAHSPTLFGTFLRWALDATVVVHTVPASGYTHFLKHRRVKAQPEIGPEGRPDKPRAGDLDGVIFEEMDTELIGSFSSALKDLQIGLQSFISGLGKLIVVVVSEDVDNRNVAKIPSNPVK